MGVQVKECLKQAHIYIIRYNTIVHNPLNSFSSFLPFLCSCFVYCLVVSNLKLGGDPLDFTQPGFAPNHYIRREGEMAACHDSNGPVSPEPLQALSPAYAAKVLGSESKLKRRRVMREQRTAEGASKNQRGSRVRAAEAPSAGSPPSAMQPTAQRGGRSRPGPSRGGRRGCRSPPPGRCRRRARPRTRGWRWASARRS